MVRIHEVDGTAPSESTTQTVSHLRTRGETAMPYRGRTIVVICCSTRFPDAINDAYRQLTLEGHIVLLPVVLGRPPTATDSVILNEVHKDKILLADVVLILTPEGYMGAGLQDELLFAKKHNKTLYYALRVEDIPLGFPRPSGIPPLPYPELVEP